MAEETIQKACRLAQSMVQDLMDCGLLDALKEEPYYSRTMKIVEEKARDFMIS